MKIALFAPVGVAIGCVFKCRAIIYRRREIKKCIERMKEDWHEIQSEEYNEIMINNMETGRKITSLCATFMYTGGISHQIIAPFLPGSIISIVDNSSKRMLVYPVFSSDVEKCLREICLIAIIEALFVICTVQYYAMTAWKNNETIGAIIYFILVEAFIFNCFIFCYVGELSKEQFRKAGEAVYMTEWYRLSHENARAMILIIAITQHPPTITAGGLMELSYNGFIFVLKTTAAYFNILRMVEF
ncbi:hypothetical protein PV327_002271 [Microctonus hyperodae]|uniref:Uncharacterized protein n=1 Tax=Microctonus hyperodae TaxID=165561 RepID=A0AA39FFD9_MICHY|nr:hypothetical protein PV327_002271 [Microctonus hyperodae]